MGKKKTNFWIKKRLHELGKYNYQLADALGLQHNKISQIIYGDYHFQIEHLSTAAEFLHFDKGKFVDFIAGKITEEELWNAKPVNLTGQDKALLYAFKAVATTAGVPKKVSVPLKQTQIPTKKERG